MPVGATVALPVAQPLTSLAAPGAVLAVSVEAPGGSKQPGPTGPVAATGKLTKL